MEAEFPRYSVARPRLCVFFEASDKQLAGIFLIVGLLVGTNRTGRPRGRAGITSVST